MICCAAAAWLFGFLVLSWKGITRRLRSPAMWAVPATLMGVAAILTVGAFVEPAIAGSSDTSGHAHIMQMCGDALSL
ncbi:hypothetical protein ACWGM0_06805 [Sphingomonas bisphenolicum]